MTEEQRKQCEEIIESLMARLRMGAFLVNKYYVSDFYDQITIDLIIFLAKVFNKDITEENAFYIVNEILKINYYKLYKEFILYQAHNEESVIKMGWDIANYFDKEEENENNK